MKGNFQLISIIVFIALAIFGLLVFSGAIPIGKSNQPGSLGTVVMWGTARADIMATLLEVFNRSNPTFIVQYVQKSSDTFDQDLLEALAGGTGPDMFLLPDNLAVHYVDKIFAIPYDVYQRATFKNNFVAAGEVFLASKGVLSIPLFIDPLLLYYNRSILDANGIVYPPVFWDDLVKLVPVLTKKDNSNKIIKSTVALGHFSNITNAKDIISALFMQAGNSIVGEEGGILSADLGAPNSYDLPSVLKFYTDFADPNNSAYSWNKSFPNSNDAFGREDVAFYFGFASELTSLVNRNPNQNFFIAPFPQIRDSNFKLTKGRVMGISLLSSSPNIDTAFKAASLMTSGDFAYKFANAFGVAPARRDLLNIKSIDSYSPIVYDSALYARSWLDPSPVNTNDIFRRMIDGVLSGSMTPRDAISDANSKLNFLLIK